MFIKKASITIFKVLIPVILVLYGCDESQVINNDSKVQNELTERVRDQFLATPQFTGQLKNYLVEWDNYEFGISKELGGEYLEFSITSLSKDRKNLSGDRRSNVTYKLIATDLDNVLNLYVLKYTDDEEEPSKNLSYSRVGYFTGIRYLINSEGRKLNFIKFLNGKIEFKGNELVKTSNDEKISRSKLGIEECYYVTTYVYMDVYQIYEGGYHELVYSYLVSVTTEETCVISGSTGGTGGSSGTTTVNETNTKYLDAYKFLDGPCEEIEKYRELAELVPTSQVLDKLTYLNTNHPSYFGDFDIHSIEDANGFVVNMDNFSVTVDELPTGMTAEGLLQEIRLNLNDFVNTNNSEFSPYNLYSDYPYDESFNWNSVNPVGTIIYIDILGDDGSVVVTKYNSNSWVFTTIEAPYTWDHPVSGNREFGFTSNSDGSYTFYTKGVDRFTQWLGGEFAAQFTFEGEQFTAADALWESFQSGIESYVNSNGGSATIQEPEFLRPSWAKMRQFLEGEIDETALGCTE